MAGRFEAEKNQIPFIAANIADKLQTALWIFDIENIAMIWANQAGLKLWNADDLESLRRRDFKAEISRPVFERLKGYLERFNRGETVLETWTLYPGGVPITLNCLCSGVQTENGMAMLVEAHPTEAHADSQALRAQEALRHVPMLLSTFDLEGTLVSRNPAADGSSARPTLLSSVLYSCLRSTPSRKLVKELSGKLLDRSPGSYP